MSNLFSSFAWPRAERDERSERVEGKPGTHRGGHSRPSGGERLQWRALQGEWFRPGQPVAPMHPCPYARQSKSGGGGGGGRGRQYSASGTLHPDGRAGPAVGPTDRLRLEHHVIDVYRCPTCSHPSHGRAPPRRARDRKRVRAVHSIMRSRAACKREPGARVSRVLSVCEQCARTHNSQSGAGLDGTPLRSCPHTRSCTSVVALQA